MEDFSEEADNALHCRRPLSQFAREMSEFSLGSTRVKAYGIDNVKGDVLRDCAAAGRQCLYQTFPVFL